MKGIVYIFALMAALTSCTDKYHVQGTSSVAILDGSKLYLKTVKDQKLEIVDSCDVIHGKFSFTGELDTTLLVNLFMDEQPLMMPLVLEPGNIVIRLDDSSRKVTGTPLNEQLYAFLDKYNQLSNRMNELMHKESQMLLSGIDEQEIANQLTGEAKQIAMEEDTLVTNFILRNSDNILGPGVFMMVTAGMEYPILTPQIEHIMSQASEAFKNDSYVKEYYKSANEIQAKMQGLDNPSPITSSEPTDSMIQSILNGTE